MTRDTPDHPLRTPTAIRVLAAVVVLVTATSVPATVSAEARSSSRIVGRGDILTTILATRSAKRRPGRTNTVPRCHEARFSDNEIEMLVAAISWDTTTPEAQRYGALVERYVSSDPATGENLEDFDLMARYCDGAVVDIRAVPRLNPATLAQQVARSMITRLPEPVVRQTPPSGSAVPVGEPVFISVDPPDWRPVHATLRFEGVTAAVRATPIAIRFFSGEPGTVFSTCQGPGERFSPSSPSSARAQATTAGACTITYHSPFRPTAEVTPRLGSISILWRTEWRVDAGPWNSLGLIPRTLVFSRQVVEVGSPITRIFDPSPRAGR